MRAPANTVMPTAALLYRWFGSSRLPLTAVPGFDMLAIAPWSGVRRGALVAFRSRISVLVRRPIRGHHPTEVRSVAVRTLRLTPVAQRRRPGGTRIRRGPSLGRHHPRGMMRHAGAGLTVDAGRNPQPASAGVTPWT